MGVLVNSRATTVMATVVTGLVIALNVYLLVQMFAGR
jgi:Mn2+/Fe2+ NRAMP family transporter